MDIIFSGEISFINLHNHLLQLILIQPRKPPLEHPKINQTPMPNFLKLNKNLPQIRIARPDNIIEGMDHQDEEG